MSTQNNSRTSLFLMELIIVILFFAIASAICLRLFVGAHLLSEKDKDLSHALVWAQNLSEGFYGCEGRILQMKNLYSNAYIAMEDNESDGALILFFDENWEEVDNSLAVASYEALINIKKEPAESVYSDVNEYGISLVGNSITGKITLIDLRGGENTYTTVPDNKDIIIYTGSIDTYIGEE